MPTFSFLKNHFWRNFTYFAIGFALFFIFRLLYGYTNKSVLTTEESSDFFSSVVQRNYASEKSVKFAPQSEKRDISPAPSSISNNPKYEKIASIQARAYAFETEEKKARHTIDAFKAVIQYEANQGNKGNRELHLLIGVAPEKFDTFAVVMKDVGAILGCDIRKTDKTNEYRNLNAKKASLESIRTSLLELKRQNGRIEEYINLQNRILEIEQELQTLGVQLGNFDEENEFCTVKFSLYEGIKTSISFFHRVKVALEWAIKYYALFLFCLIAMLVATYVLLAVLDRWTNVKNKLH
jgi:Domain of unknown function (DUF4349)